MNEFKCLFSPNAVAVLGASATSGAPANEYIRRLKAYGFTGSIYPIHRTASEIEGLPAFGSLAETPTPIHYAYVAIAAQQVPEVLSVVPPQWVRFAQVISSGFSETDGGADLERRLVSAAQRVGMRLVGPNCLGMHSTIGRVTFIENADTEQGPVSVISQSGGLAVDILRRGKSRGLKFAHVITLGNCADIKPGEMLEFLAADDNTKVIGLYLENLSDGPRFVAQLRKMGSRKPVVLLRGGRSLAGQRAAASHTGTLASDDRLWVALARQTGTVLVPTLDKFLDSLLALQFTAIGPIRPAEKIILFGNGGGTSVLGVDCLQDMGFDVPPISPKHVAELDELRLPPGSSIQNPIDVPASALRAEKGLVAQKILNAITGIASIDAIIMHLNVAVLLGYRKFDLVGQLMNAAVSAKREMSSDAHFFLVLRSDGDFEVEAAKQEFREKSLLVGIAVFDEISNAADGLAAVRTVERFRRNRSLAAA